MRIKKSEQKHMEALGPRWSQAVAAASLVIRMSPKLMGLDKIREPMAISAALCATGCGGHDGFVIPANAGQPTQEMQDIIDHTYAAAVEAARKKMRVPA